MIKILKLTIQGFKAIQEPQTIDYTQYNQGFYFVTGENKIDEKLGSNGASKSTFFSDALCWLLFGKTSINLKAGNVKNWHSKISCKGSLEFGIGDDKYVLARSWDPIKITINDKGISQEELELLIGFNFNSFLYSVVISQFTRKFFDLQAAEKLPIFSDILELENWIIRSIESTKKVKKYDSDINIKQLDINKITGQLSLLENQDYTKEKEQWVQEQKNVVGQKINQTQNKKNKIVELEKDLKKNVRKNDVQREIESLNSQITHLEEQETKLKEVIKKYTEEITKDKVHVDIRQKEIKKFEGVKDKCPYCDQKVSKIHIEEKLTQLVKEKIKLSDSCVLLNKERDKEDQALQKIEEQINKIIDKINKIKEDDKKQKQNQVVLKIEIDNYKTDIEQLEKELLQENKKINPYIAIEEKNQKEKIKLQQENLKIFDGLKLLQREKEHTNYWIKGFKEIRLMIIEEALGELSIYTNNIVQKLGLIDWEIKFAVDKINNDGSVKKGFTVLVKSPKNKELVPFECWSGGEGQRLRLAGTLGLILFTRVRTSSKANLLIMDEPTQWLSPEGIDDLLFILKDLSGEEQLKIFLVDQRDLSSSGIFDGVINIVKEKETGARIKGLM